MKIKSLVFILVTLISTAVFANPGLKVGDYAPDFSLKNVDGSMVSLKDFGKAKGFIVVFMCNHCPYVKLYQDRIMALDKQFAKQGYPVIGINPNDPETYPSDSYEEMKAKAKEKGYTFPYLVDETQEVAKAYGPTRTPQVYLLKKEGDKYKVAYIGAIDDDTQDRKDEKVKYVENAVEAVEKGKDPDPDFTKAIGCTIKWKE